MKLAAILLTSLLGWQAFAATEGEPVVPQPQALTAEVLIQVAGPNGPVETKILASSFNQTLYSFDPDSGAPGTSACNAKCAEVWPPITVTEGEVAALNNPDLGTVKRATNLVQLTFKGMPVYQFNMDRVAGDIKGDGIGGVWHIITL